MRVVMHLQGNQITHLHNTIYIIVYQSRGIFPAGCNYPLRADTHRLHQAGVSLSEEGGGRGGAGGELSRGRYRGGRGGGDGQRHGAGLLLHSLDSTQQKSKT